MRTRSIVAVGAALAVAVPVMSGCSARVSQFIDISQDGGGTLLMEMRLDPAAQRALNLPRQLQEGTFERFLDVRTERWRAPGASGGPFSQRTEADGTVVMRSVRRLKAGTSQLDDLNSALGVLRPIEPILSATGRYWAAPNPGDSPTTTSTTPESGNAPGGEAPQGITGLPLRVPLQEMLVDDFTAAYRDRGRSLAPTFSIASRGGVGDVLDPPCNAGSRRVDFTTADLALQKGLQFRYAWAMPARIAQYSVDGKISRDRYVASWAMPRSVIFG